MKVGPCPGITLPFQKWLLADAEGTVRQEKCIHPSGTEIPVPPPTPGPSVHNLVGISFPCPTHHTSLAKNPTPTPILLCSQAVLFCPRAACHDGVFSLCLPAPGLPRTLTAKDDQNQGDKGHNSLLTHLCWPRGTRLTLQCPPSSHCYGNILPRSSYGKVGFLPTAGASH